MSKSFKLISDAIADVIQADYNKKEYKIKPFKINNGTGVFVGAVRVTRGDNGAELFLSDGIGGAYLTAWKNDVGGLLLNDFKKKQYDTVYEMKAGNYYTLLRKAQPDELDELNEKGFVHLEVKSVVDGYSYYTILRVCKTSAEYYARDTTGMSDFVSVYEEEESSTKKKDSEDEDEDNTSYALF